MSSEKNYIKLLLKTALIKAPYIMRAKVLL